MTATTQFSTANQLGVNFNQVFTPSTDGYPYASDVPPVAAGTVVYGTDETAWMYVLASSAIALNDVVMITSSNTAAPLSTSTGAFGALVGVAAGVAIPSASYGWVQRLGKCVGLNVLNAAAPNVQLATTSTAGALDDSTATATKNINGIIITATNNAGSAASIAGTLNWPVVGTTN